MGDASKPSWVCQSVGKDERLFPAVASDVLSTKLISCMRNMAAAKDRPKTLAGGTTMVTYAEMHQFKNLMSLRNCLAGNGCSSVSSIAGGRHIHSAAPDDLLVP